jgi:hypothetical protein
MRLSASPFHYSRFFKRVFAVITDDAVNAFPNRSALRMPRCPREQKSKPHAICNVMERKEKGRQLLR